MCFYGTFALGGLFKSDDERKADASRTKDIFIKTAQELGYEPFMATHNGEIKYGVKLKNGEIKDITPDFLDLLGANANELVGSLGGTAVALATKSPVAGGAVRSLLAPATARALTYGAVGSGAGAVADYTRNTANTDGEFKINEAIKAGVGGASNEALGAGLAELLNPAIKSFKATGKISAEAISKAADYMPILKTLREQNVGGALKELQAQMGGKEALDEFLKQADEMGVRVNINDGSYLASVAKEELEKAGQKVDDFNAQNELMQKGKEWTQKGVNLAKDAVDTAQNLFFKNDEITKNQSDFLTAARGNERVAQIASNALSSNATAANRMNEIITADTNKILDEFNALKGADDISVKDMATNYEARVKQEFNDGLKALEDSIGDIKTTIYDIPTSKEFLNDINELKAREWGGVANTRLKNILENLANGKEIDISGVNGLRAELNDLIADAQQNSVKRIARNIKDYVESDILDDILTKSPLQNEAKSLYKTMVSEYKDMKNITDSTWFKTAQDIDKGEDSVINAISKVIDEKASNNSVDSFLSKHSDKDISKVELGLLEKALNKHTYNVGTNGKVLDIKSVIKAVSNHNFRSGDAKNFVNLLNKLDPLIGQDIKLADAIGIYKKGEKIQQGFSTDPTTRIYTMMANRTIKTALRLAPIIGRQPSLIHHVEQAILKSKNYNGFINNLTKIATDKNIPNSIRAELTKFLTARDDLTPKQEAKEATNAINVNKNPSIDELNALQKQNTILGENFAMAKEGKLTYLDNVKFELDKVLKEKTGIDEAINASLAWLKSKHPEMFKNQRAVKELIDYVLDNPNRVTEAKTPNSVFIAKNDGKKVKDIVINKDDNKIIHANARRMNKDEIKKSLASGDALLPHADTMPTGALKLENKSHLAKPTDGIIPKNEAKSEVSLENSDDFTPFSHPIIGGGLLGGGLNGVERDENGDVKLDFDEFVRGFFGGALGTKLASLGLKKSNPSFYNRIMGYANKYPKVAQTDPAMLGDMLRRGKDKELREIENNIT
ncbi:hypothetical protein CR66_01580 [Campylobacter mucosalis]|uniref:hypothetical protein n=1 Tax=Campylobacter mucosalis TaxID=202 RepID=UPI0004D5A8A7|nr:hypothetical protein [Campylobacter mucosalis]KEA46556.1 hypothetical protein CR66_01580 [Campylobacter mucosalis]QKF62940.1 hypothetical protein CMCT_0801 [Campylobacter mucosalis]